MFGAIGQRNPKLGFWVNLTQSIKEKNPFKEIYKYKRVEFIWIIIDWIILSPFSWARGSEGFKTPFLLSVSVVKYSTLVNKLFIIIYFLLILVNNGMFYA